MGERKHGQVAMEYLIVVGLSVAMTLPLLFIFATQSAQMDATIAQAQIEKVAFQIESAAREVYYLGPPSKQTIEVTFPHHVASVSLDDTLMGFNMTLPGFPHVFYVEFEMNLTGAIQPFQGLHVLVIEATATGVDITER